MSDRNVEELTEKAKAISKLVIELEALAEEAGFGISIEDATVSFRDWQSSDCYGEGTGEDFTVSDDSVWYSSGC